MARLSPFLLALVLGAAAAVVLASCGGSGADLLPGTTAEEIESNLDQVEALAGDEDCVGAEDAVAEVTEEVENLEGVDLKLKTALQEGTARLSEVVGECEEEIAGEETEPSFESDVGDEEVEEKKPKKEKPEKEKPAKEEPAEGEGPTLPPQSNGKGEEKGKGGEEPVEPETETEETPSSGGVGPSVGVE